MRLCGMMGKEKYQEFTEIELEPEEYVHIEYGYDIEKYGVAVNDYLNHKKLCCLK